MATLNFVHHCIEKMVSKNKLTPETTNDDLITLLSDRDKYDIIPAETVKLNELYSIEDRNNENDLKAIADDYNNRISHISKPDKDFIKKGTFPEYVYKPVCNENTGAIINWQIDHEFGEGFNEDIYTLINIAQEKIMSRVNYYFVTAEIYQEHKSNPEYLKQIEEFLFRASSERGKNSPYYVEASLNYEIIQKYGLEMAWQLFQLNSFKAWHENVYIFLNTTASPERIKSILNYDNNVHFLTFILQDENLINNPDLNYAHFMWRRSKWLYKIDNLSSEEIKNLDKEFGARKVTKAAEKGDFIEARLAGDDDNCIKEIFSKESVYYKNYEIRKDPNAKIFLKWINQFKTAGYDYNLLVLVLGRKTEELEIKCSEIFTRTSSFYQIYQEKFGITPDFNTAERVLAKFSNEEINILNKFLDNIPIAMNLPLRYYSWAYFDEFRCATLFGDKLIEIRKILNLQQSQNNNVICCEGLEDFLSKNFMAISNNENLIDKIYELIVKDNATAREVIDNIKIILQI